MQSLTIKDYRNNIAMDAIFCCNFYRYRLVEKLHQKSESGTGRILGATIRYLCLSIVVWSGVPISLILVGGTQMMVNRGILFAHQSNLSVPYSKLFANFVTGPPTYSVGGQYCFALWRLLSSSVTLHVGHIRQVAGQ